MSGVKYENISSIEYIYVFDLVLNPLVFWGRIIWLDLNFRKVILAIVKWSNAQEWRQDIQLWVYCSNFYTKWIKYKGMGKDSGKRDESALSRQLLFKPFKIC